MVFVFYTMVFICDFLCLSTCQHFHLRALKALDVESLWVFIIPRGHPFIKKKYIYKFRESMIILSGDWYLPQLFIMGSAPNPQMLLVLIQTMQHLPLSPLPLTCI